MHLKMSSAKWRPIYLGLNVLTHWFVSFLWIILVIKNKSMSAEHAQKSVSEDLIDEKITSDGARAWCFRVKKHYFNWNHYELVT